MIYQTDWPPSVTNSDGFIHPSAYEIDRRMEHNDLVREIQDEPRRSWSTCTWDNIRKWEKFTGEPAVIGKI